MNRKVSRFLLESWQLFYWSFFCPSLLKQWMNEWLPQKTEEGLQIDTSASDILKTNSRFVLQYFLVWTSLSLPLAGLAASSGRGWDLFIYLIAFLIGYLSGVWFLPSGIGLCSPLLLALIYWQEAEFFAKALQSLSPILSGQPKLFAGMCLGSITLSTTSFVVWILLKKNYLSFARNIFWAGSGLSFLLGSWIVSQNWLTTLFSATLISIFAFFIRDLLNSEDSKGIIEVLGAVLVSGSVIGILAGSFLGFSTGILIFVLMFLLLSYLTFFNILAIGFNFSGNKNLRSFSAVTLAVIDGIAFVLAFVVAVVMSSVLVGIAVVPLHWFLLISALLAFGCAPLKHRWLGVQLSVIFATLGWVNLGLQALWAVPVSLMLYYRIVPDYLVAYQTILILSFNQSRLKWFSINPASLLTKLPPYTTELLWFPLHNHAQILAATFRQDVTFGLNTFQKMQAISLPGFQLTIEKALPLIVANQFAGVRTTSELVESVTAAHPLLPLLIPDFYQFDEGDRLSLPPTENAEIDFLFTLLQQTAKDTTAALQAGSSALRERGLKRLVDRLISLPTDLPGLGLEPQAVIRWLPAIKWWQHILELEIAEQQKTSQGELLNPFQFGNPLRPDRAAIFKGRQDFADRLVRQILDRNRPTLVLHGPRRAGKTSFLLNLPRLLPSDLVPIYLDMQQGSMTASEGDFCYGLVRAIDRDTRSQGLQLPPSPSRSDFAQRPYPTLEDWLDLALPQLGERRLLLNLDEFEKIGSAIKDNRISERLFDQLRSMIQHYDRLGFLFSGVQTLEELGPRWSNYFISVVPMEMHYLEPHEAEDLLTNPDPEFTLRYDAGIVDEILRLTRCQPYLLQLVGSALVDRANRQQTQLATNTLLQAAIQDAFTNGEPYFTNIWTEFTGTTPAEVTAGQQFLKALAQGNSLLVTDEISITSGTAELNAAHRRLRRYHVIERIEGKIDKIEIPLFEQWVRERAIAT